jgi:hypothetical protein
MEGSAQSMLVEGESVRITGQPDVDRVTIAIGEACEITLPSGEAMQFALLLFRVASAAYVERQRPQAGAQPAEAAAVVM